MRMDCKIAGLGLKSKFCSEWKKQMKNDEQKESCCENFAVYPENRQRKWGDVMENDVCSSKRAQLDGRERLHPEEFFGCKWMKFVVRYALY